MAKASPILTAFNAGEWSPDLDGRVDVDGYHASAAVMENFLPTIQGPLERRGGTRYLGPGRGGEDAGRPWLVPFIRSRRLAYMLEFSDGGIRVWGQGGAPLSPAVVITAPWTAADLVTADGEFGLDVAQSGDVMYIAARNGKHELRRLRRTGPETFVLGIVRPVGGPLEDFSTSGTMWVSAVSGTVTITASNAQFDAARDVGRLIRIDAEDDPTPYWKPDSGGTGGNTYVLSDGKEYQNQGGSSSSGTQPPTHTRGTVSDGSILWTYRSARYGVARITAVTSPTVAEAVVTVRFPTSLTSAPNASTFWRWGAWFTNVWPTAVTFFRERLAVGRGPRVDMSWSGLPEKFDVDDAGQITPECATSIALRSGRIDDVVSMADGPALLVNTEGGEMLVGPQTDTEAFGPSNIRAVFSSAFGAQPVRAVRVGDQRLVVQAGGRRLRAHSFSAAEDALTSTDTLVRAGHLTEGDRIVGLARQEEPRPMVWARTAQGKLLALAYDPKQNVMGWSRIEFGASAAGARVLSFAVLPTADGTEETLWLALARGNGPASIERLAPGWRKGEAANTACFFDAALTYDGTPVTSVTGAGHLAGQTVAVLADGAAHPDVVVAGDGTITLERAASVVTVGYRTACAYVSPRLEAAAADGTAQAKLGRITDVAFRLRATLGGEAGAALDKLLPIPATNQRAPAMVMGSPPPLFTGDAICAWTPGHNLEKRIAYRNDSGYPVQISAIMPQVVVSESR